MTTLALHSSKAVFISWDAAEGWHLHLTSADRNETLKCYLASRQKRRAKPSFLDVVPYRVSLRVLSRVWPYCSPRSSYGLPTQPPNCFVDVKYCTLPREPWSQWSQELLSRLTVTLCSWIVKRQNQKHKWTQTECPDLKKKPDWIWCKLAFMSLHNPLHLSQLTFWGWGGGCCSYMSFS